MISLDRKFYIQNLTKIQKNIKIYGEEKHHLEVLRPNVQDKFWATNGKGKDFLCKISNITKEFIEAKIVDIKEKKYYPLHIHLYFGVTKRKKWEWLIEKATELGTMEFTPLITENNKQYAKGFYKKKKQIRFEKKMIAAMKQSRRSFLPKLNDPIEFSGLKGHKNVIKNSFVLSFKGQRWKCGDVNELKELNLIIGPEGGLTEEEEDELIEKGSIRKNMGLHTLKTETAALKALSILTYFRKDF